MDDRMNPRNGLKALRSGTAPYRLNHGRSRTKTTRVPFPVTGKATAPCGHVLIMRGKQTFQDICLFHYNQSRPCARRVRRLMEADKLTARNDEKDSKSP